MATTCVALDMDETLGHFAEASGAWKAAALAWPPTRPLLSQGELETFILATPGVLRPGLKDTMDLLERARTEGSVDRVVIYTNNTARRDWADTVAGAVNRLAGAPVIDQVVAGYGREPGRVSHDKTFDELCRCIGMVPDHCVFVDDQVHPGMRHPAVTYIHADAHTRTASRAHATGTVRAATGWRLPVERASDAVRLFPVRARGVRGTPLTQALAAALAT